MTIRRTVAWLFVTALLLSGLAFAQTDLTFWSWRVEDADEYAEIIAEYQSMHPDVNIEFVTFNSADYATALSAALAAGEAGDILHVRAYGAFEAIAEPGFLLALDDKVPALADFPPLSVAGETLRSDGRVYAVPFASQTLVIYYNAEMFADLGLEPPRDWDAFLAASQTILDAGIIPLANGTATGWMNEVFTGVFGPAFYGPDFFDEVVAGETDFTDPRYVSALENMLELRPYMAPDFSGVDYPTAQNLFANGLAAMFVGGSWEIANFRDLNPDLDFALMAGPAAEPGGQQIVSTFLDGGYAVNATSANQDAAVEFVNFLATQEFGQMLADNLSNISPIPGVAFNDPLLAQVGELNQNATPYIMLVGFRYENPTGSTLLQERLSGMFSGDMAPAQVAQEVTDGIAAYYEPFQGN
jgi:raffinose/stachyose/melibiose transport system substrate-binding protein